MSAFTLSLIIFAIWSTVQETEKTKKKKDWRVCECRQMDEIKLQNDNGDTSIHN